MQIKYSYPPYFTATLLLLGLLFCVPRVTWAQEEEEETVYHGTYYEQEQLNAGLPARDMTHALRTPQAALEHFVLSARTNDFQTAAYALNLNLLPVEEQAARSPHLARQLYHLLQQHTLIEWDTLPDRTDGQIDTASPQNENPMVGVPRRNIRLGDFMLNGRSVPIRVQRVKVEGQPPVWVFSSSTVENIPALYNQYAPGFLARYMPAWAQVYVGGGVALWEWAVVAILLLISSSVGLVIKRGADRAFSSSVNFWAQGLTRTIVTPTAVVISLMLLFVSVRTSLNLTGSFTRFIDYAILILLIITATWLVMSIIRFITDYMIEQHVLSETEKDVTYARQLATYLFVGRRVVLFLALLGGTVLLLQALGVFERISMSLLASAGIFTIILGIAAQRFLGDIVAGLQIALTQPVRVGDSIEFEGAWGVVTRITYTYLTIHTWDKRRVVVPLQYFMSQPMENLTKTDATLIKPVYLHVDHRTDIEQVRQAFAAFLEQDADWNRATPPLVHVTNMTEKTLEVRLLCSANDPETAWNLRFRVSEHMMAHLRDLDGGRYLPKQRLLIERSRHSDH